MRVTKENTVGLVIDIQERLFPVMNEKEALLKNCKTLVAGLNELNVPMVVSQQYTKGLGETLGEISTLISGFTSCEKKEFSCWDNTEIAAKLKEMEAQNIIISGIESHVCVLQTAVDLKDAGLNPIVVMDCVSSRTAGNYELAKEHFSLETLEGLLKEILVF